MSLTKHLRRIGKVPPMTDATTEQLICVQAADRIDELESKLAASEEARKKAEAGLLKANLLAEKFERKYYLTLDRAEAAEKLIEDSRKQEPVAWIVAEQVDNGIGISVDSALSWDKVESHAYPSTPLYTQPPIPPEVAELQRENAELTRKLAEQQAIFSTLGVSQLTAEEELTKLLEEAKRQAVPEDSVLVKKNFITYGDCLRFGINIDDI